MPDTGKTATSDIDLKGAFASSANAHEQLSQALAASIDPDRAAPIILSGSQQSEQSTKALQSEKRRRADRGQLHLTLIDQAMRLSEKLGRQIARSERMFEQEFGDAWREQIAMRVLEPDAIPQRRNGESMGEYRSRLEDVLIATMINPQTGAIRPEYANDHETQSYAEWAQARHQKREVDAYIERRSDPGLSDAERVSLDQDYQAKFGAEETILAQRELAANGDSVEAVDQRINAEMDAAKSDVTAEAMAFGKPLG